MRRVSIFFSCIIALVAFGTWAPEAGAYMRYNDGCQNCHGAFPDATSTKGSVFPADSKHEMHRNASYMNTECNLCHTSGDNKNPYIGSSNGTADNPGLGCTGCHDAFGLRAHHAINDVTECAGCHTGDSTPQPENTVPVYYGTIDTNADMPCNPVAQSNINENWTIGDFEGLDNDGDNLYDGNDPDCAAAGVCGDGNLDADEECDDGNTADGDCCSANCTFEAQGSSCADESFCNGDETCDGAGTCDPGTAVVCDDNVGCTDDSCDETMDMCRFILNDANCDDGLFCNGAETCDAVNDCQAGTPPCDPATETCDEFGDVCEPIGCQSDAECDNGLFCDGAETCDTGTGQCLPGTAVAVDDGVGCTDDSCDEANDVVVNAPNDGLCDNGQFCDGTETCDAVNDCQAGTPVNVDDGVSCTDDSCDEVNDVVVNAPNDGLCDNGAFCDGAETCDAVNDCQAGVDPCPGQACDEVGDVCEPIGCQSDAECDNGAFCDGAETCDTGTGQCLPGTPVVVDDGVGCTDDSCDEANDVVVNAPNDGLCDNGAFCDGTETCDAVNDCQAGTPINVDDGVGCTDDSCDEVNDVVVNAPNDALCDNGLFCDGAETCDAINDCQAGTPPCDPATETCDEAGDVCEPIGCQSDADCDNGAFCDGAETCDTGTGQCLPGTPVVVDDGVGCTDDSCDEVNDVVVNRPNDANCENGLFCDGAETCDAVNDCQAGTPPCDPATETCDEVNDQCVPPTEGDAWLDQMRAPKSLRLSEKKQQVQIDVIAKGDSSVDQDVTVSLTAIVSNPVNVHINVLNSPITQLVGAGNGRTSFSFDADIKCNILDGQTYSVDWVTKIESASQNSDPNNDEQIRTTSITCRQPRGGKK